MKAVVFLVMSALFVFPVEAMDQEDCEEFERRKNFRAEVEALRRRRGMLPHCPSSGSFATGCPGSEHQWKPQVTDLRKEFEDLSIASPRGSSRVMNKPKDVALDTVTLREDDLQLAAEQRSLITFFVHEGNYMLTMLKAMLNAREALVPCANAAIKKVEKNHDKIHAVLLKLCESCKCLLVDQGIKDLSENIKEVRAAVAHINLLLAGIMQMQANFCATTQRYREICESECELSLINELVRKKIELIHCSMYSLERQAIDSLVVMVEKMVGVLQGEISPLLSTDFFSETERPVVDELLVLLDDRKKQARQHQAALYRAQDRALSLRTSIIRHYELRDGRKDAALFAWFDQQIERAVSV